MQRSDGSLVTLSSKSDILFAMLGTPSDSIARYCRSVYDTSMKALFGYQSRQQDTALTELPGGPALQYPITVQVIHQNDCVIINSLELEIFGYGDTFSEALDDFAQSTRQLYEGLQESSGLLSEPLEDIRLRLHRLFRPSVS
jgi:hypothetical protein